MSNIQFSKRSYMQPTPANFRKFADGLLGISSVITASAISEEIKWLAYVALFIGVCGKFLSNFFAKKT